MSEFAIWLTLGSIAIPAGMALAWWAMVVDRANNQSMLGETDLGWLGWTVLGIVFILAGSYFFQLAYGALQFSQ